MKRTPFLGAAAALVLSACGGRHVTKILPGVAPSANNQTSKTAAGDTPADEIPSNVLQHPIVGEARRFGGTTPPGGWVLAQGQTLNVADNPRLLSILGPRDAKSTFALPHPKNVWIIAVAGTFPARPGFDAQLGRNKTPGASLGPGARPGQPRLRRLRDDPFAAQTRKATSFIRPLRPETVSAETSAQLRAVRQQARDAAVATLGAENRTALQATVSSIVSGRVSVHDATLALTGALSGGEAQAVLAVSDGLIRSFPNSPPVEPHRELQLEAARFLVSVAVTRDEMRAVLRAQQRSIR